MKAAFLPALCISRGRRSCRVSRHLSMSPFISVMTLLAAPPFLPSFAFRNTDEFLLPGLLEPSARESSLEAPCLIIILASVSHCGLDIRTRNIEIHHGFVTCSPVEAAFFNLFGQTPPTRRMRKRQQNCTPTKDRLVFLQLLCRTVQFQALCSGSNRLYMIPRWRSGISHLSVSSDGGTTSRCIRPRLPIARSR